MNQLFVRAIKEKHLLSFMYDNHQRIVEPHCYGITTAGKEGLRCYQVGGSGVEPNKTMWHLMIVDKIRSLTMLNDSFSGARPGYRKGDKGMSTIFYEL